MAVMLECKGLEFSFTGKQVIYNIDFNIQKGTFTVILGRNGSGKTTLMNCLNRILLPGSGNVTILGKNLMSLSTNEIARLISLVPQEHIDIFPYSVLDVVVMGRAPFLKIAQKPGDSDYAIAINALKDLNAEYLAPHNFNRISGGERQIALLARALAQTTPVMLLDEPTNHLDFNNQYHLLAAIKHLCRLKKISILASMHDPNLASVFADDIIMIKNGTIMKKGQTASVMTRENLSTLYNTDTGEIWLNDRKKMFFPAHILG